MKKLRRETLPRTPSLLVVSLGIVASLDGVCLLLTSGAAGPNGKETCAMVFSLGQWISAKRRTDLERPVLDQTLIRCFALVAALKMSQLLGQTARI
jgi:hypothetical protein